MLDWQWKEKVIPLLEGGGQIRPRARHSQRIALEMHPEFRGLQPPDAVEVCVKPSAKRSAPTAISAIFSGKACDPVEVIHFLGKQGAIFHAHMKDTVLFPENVRNMAC